MILKGLRCNHALSHKSNESRYHFMHAPGLKTGRRSNTPVLAMLSYSHKSKSRTDEVIIIPMKYAQLLSLKGREIYMDPLITAAYESLLTGPMEEGYSPVATLGREKLLFAARDGMRSVKGRAPLLHPDITIEPMLLPGALSLLEQVGQHNLAIQLGTAALAKNAAKELRPSGVSKETMKDFERDIALATALAHCGIARDAADRGHAGMACAQMEEALGLLKSYNAAPGLAAQVVDALDQLKPAALLDDLKAPLDLDDKVSGRQSAVAAFKAMLNGGGEQQGATLFVGPAVSGGRVVDRDYIASAFKTLTSVELCSLADWAKLASTTTTADAKASSSPAWFEPSMLSAAGMAHIAAGFTTRQPSYIATAKKIYSAAATREAGVDVNVPLAVCQVLLGNPETALAILKQDEDMAAAAATTSRGGGTSLSAHDAALSVAVALESKRINQLPPREGVVQFIRAASSMGTSSNPATFNGDLLPGLCLFVERWLTIVVLPKLRDTRQLVSAGSGNNVVVSLGMYFEDDAVQEALAKEHSTSSSLLVSLAAGLGNSKIVKAVKSLGNERTFVGLGERGARQLAAGAMLAMFGGVLLLASSKYGMFGSSSSGSRRMHLLPPPQATTTTSAAADASVTGTTNAATKILTTLTSKHMTDSTSSQQQQQQQISRDAALRLVKQWLDIKAQAMGPRHMTDNLTQVLAPPMLSAVKAEAQEAAESGWFWTIRPNGAKIDSINCSAFKGTQQQQQQGKKGGSGGSNKGNVVVVATIDESADLWASNGKKGDSYKTKYRVEYTMVEVGGEWRIASALVLGGK